jgi:hypothetical protein
MIKALTWRFTSDQGLHHVRIGGWVLDGRSGAVGPLRVCRDRCYAGGHILGWGEGRVAGIGAVSSQVDVQMAAESDRLHIPLRHLPPVIR